MNFSVACAISLADSDDENMSDTAGCWPVCQVESWWLNSRRTLNSQPGMQPCISLSGRNELWADYDLKKEPHSTTILVTAFKTQLNSRGISPILNCFRSHTVIFFLHSFSRLTLIYLHRIMLTMVWSGTMMLLHKCGLLIATEEAEAASSCHSNCACLMI